MNNLDDIFDKLNKSLMPSVKQLRELQESLGNRVRGGIIDDLMNASTIEEVEFIEIENDMYFELWPVLPMAAQNARKRINNLFKAKIETWGIHKLN